MFGLLVVRWVALGFGLNCKAGAGVVDSDSRDDLGQESVGTIPQSVHAHSVTVLVLFLVQAHSFDGVLGVFGEVVGRFVRLVFGLFDRLDRRSVDGPLSLVDLLFAASEFLDSLVDGWFGVCVGVLHSSGLVNRIGYLSDWRLVQTEEVSSPSALSGYYLRHDVVGKAVVAAFEHLPASAVGVVHVQPVEPIDLFDRLNADLRACVLTRVRLY